MNSAVFAVAIFCLPKSADDGRRVLQRFRTEVDWVGALLISSALGLLSYVLAAVMMRTSEDVEIPSHIVDRTSGRYKEAFPFGSTQLECSTNDPSIPPLPSINSNKQELTT